MAYSIPNKKVSRQFRSKMCIRDSTYMAPEVYKGEAYGSTVDIYSLGIVLYRLLNGNRTPFLPAAPAPITHAAASYTHLDVYKRQLLVRSPPGALHSPPADLPLRPPAVSRWVASQPDGKGSSPVFTSVSYTHLPPPEGDGTGPRRIPGPRRGNPPALPPPSSGSP